MKTYSNLRKLNDKRTAVDVTTKGWFGRTKTKTLIICFSDWLDAWYDTVRRCAVDEELATWIYLNMDNAGIKFKGEQMYVTENSMGLCIVLENTGDIAKVLTAFTDYNICYNTPVPIKVLEALEEEISP